ncbi:hypothetical protein [Streptomyces orinoci]|uniref:Uncharacterized protein n=1 Tax=Streptomyces orinoci TaxID=67339 RepID=A0ABV3JX78_STRON|nr:hypothetical protein [Streptomyces orinoci]
MTDSMTHAKRTAPVDPPRCPTCAQIKAAYYRSVREGNREAAVSWTAEMGRHLRSAHG